MGDVAPTSTPLVVEQPDAVNTIKDKPEVVEETNEQPDAAVKQGSANNSGHVAWVVALVPPS